MTDIRKETAIILQDDGLFPWKTVYDNVALPMQIENLKPNLIEDTVVDLLKRLDIGCHMDKFPPHTLSGGEKKRVAIARALAKSPNLLLMDEPTGSLDMITKEQFQDQILNIYKSQKLTMMLVTHDIEEAAFLGEKIIVMNEGSVSAVLDNPTFLKDDIRHQIEFYELCLKIRKELSL